MLSISRGLAADQSFVLGIEPGVSTASEVADRGQVPPRLRFSGQVEGRLGWGCGDRPGPNLSGVERYMEIASDRAQGGRGATSWAAGEAGGWDELTTSLWDALVHDTASGVFVLDDTGRIAFANKIGSRHLLPTGGELTGRSLADLFSPEFCNERLRLLREVISTGQPVVVRGMCRGVWTDCSCRRLSGGGAGRPAYAMVISRPPLSAETEMEAPEGMQMFCATVPDLGPLATLTQRELEVLKLIGEGLSTAAVGKRLFRSQRTVQWHRVTLGKKLGVTNRVELARIAIFAGLTRMPLEGLYQALRGGRLPPPRPVIEADLADGEPVLGNGRAGVAGASGTADASPHGPTVD